MADIAETNGQTILLEAGHSLMTRDPEFDDGAIELSQEWAEFCVALKASCLTSSAAEQYLTAIQVRHITPWLSRKNLTLIPMAASKILTAEALDTAISAKLSHSLNQDLIRTAADELETLGPAPRDAELAEALLSGMSIDLLERALAHPEGLRGTVRSLHQSMSESTAPQIPHFMLNESGQAVAQEIDRYLQTGADIILDGSVINSFPDIGAALNLPSFVINGSFDTDQLVKALSLALQLASVADTQKPGFVICGLGDAVFKLGKSYSTSEGISLGIGLIEEVQRQLKTLDETGLPHAELSLELVSADILRHFSCLTSGTNGIDIQISDLPRSPDAIELIRDAISASHPEFLPEFETTLAQTCSLQGVPGVDRERLLARGFSPCSVDLIEDRLSEGLNLSQATSRWLLGDDVILKELNLPPTILSEEDPSLLRLVGFSRKDIEQAERYLSSAATRTLSPVLEKSGLVPNTTPDQSLTFAVEVAKATHLQTSLSVERCAGQSLDVLAKWLSCIEGQAITLLLSSSDVSRQKQAADRVNHILSLAEDAREAEGSFNPAVQETTPVAPQHNPDYGLHDRSRRLRLPDRR